jgi:hypothetical protein
MRASFAQVRLVLSKARGTVWFDDVSLFTGASSNLISFSAPEFGSSDSSDVIDDQEDPDEAPIEADPTFRQGEIYSYPNPAQGGMIPTIHVECGIADWVEFRIYNIAGELLHQARLDQAPQIINSKYAYEYKWDTSGIASGVYICVVVAKNSGLPDVKAITKPAVVR